MLHSALVAALVAVAPAEGADAHYPRYEADMYRSRMDVATVGLVISGLGLVGGGVGFVSEEPTISDLLGVQGTLFLAGGATVATVGALSARAYPLERKPTLAPGVAALGLAGLSGVGLLVWAGNADEALHDTLLYGSLGVAAASTGFAVIQMGADAAAWRDRQRRTDGARAHARLVPTPGGAALVGRF